MAEKVIADIKDLTPKIKEG
jgi:K(+)-stimulated pyrophosphate-energized sodium pump